MSAFKMVAICFVVACVPIGAVVAMKYNDIAANMHVDPATAEGKVIYFMAPSR